MSVAEGIMRLREGSFQRNRFGASPACPRVSGISFRTATASTRTAVCGKSFSALGGLCPFFDEAFVVVMGVGAARPVLPGPGVPGVHAVAAGDGALSWTTADNADRCGTGNV